MTRLKEKFLSPSCFGLVILCFFLPFIDIKCNDVELANVKGIELVTGSQISSSEISLPPVSKDESKNPDLTFDHQSIDINYFAVAAFVLALGGLVLYFLLKIQKELFMGIIGFGGVLSLLLMRVQVDHSIEASTEGMSRYVVHIDYVYGYWLCMIFFLIAGAVNLFAHIEEQQLKMKHPEL